jgi:hypothetical protein
VTGTWIAVTALGVTLVATPAVIVLARRTGIVDRPGSLKPQPVEVPYLGGLAVWAGTMVGVLIGRPVVGIPLTAALFLGVVDDRFGLTPGTRLFGEVVIGVAVAIAVPSPSARCGRHPPRRGGMRATHQRREPHRRTGHAGRRGGGRIAAVGFRRGPPRVRPAAGHRAGCAALVGFLWSTTGHRRGSTWVTAGPTSSARRSPCCWRTRGGRGVATAVGVATMALVAVPVAEVAFAVVRRRRGRQSMLAGDRGHPYDRLVARGWSRPGGQPDLHRGGRRTGHRGVLAVHLVSVTLAVAVDVIGARC